MFPNSHKTLSLICGLSASLILPGCGGGSTPEPSETAPVAQSATNSNHQPVVAQEPPAKVDPNKKETKWIGDIPYDVFYDQPLTIAADTTALQGSVSVASSSYPPDKVNGGPAAMATEPPASATPASTNASTKVADWAKVIPITVLNDEIKSLRTKLTANLQSVGSYNRAIKEISLDGAILCTMGAIATVHPEDISWKEKAKYVRDLGYAIYSNAEGTGRTPFTACKEPFEQLLTILDGGPAPDIEAEDVVDHSDNVYTSEMMKRIEISFNSLKANINTEDRMNEDPATVERELRVLAAFGTMMGTESFEYVEEPKYQGFLSKFTGGALTAVDAVQTKNFIGFQDALNQIQTTCSECHQQYRGSDSGF